MTQASEGPPKFYELPHELRGARVCLRPYAIGDGVVVQEAIEESRDHLRPWMARTKFPKLLIRKLPYALSSMNEHC